MSLRLLSINILLLVTVGLALSCKKNKLEGEYEVFVGKWNWLYTDRDYGWCDGPYLEETITPDSHEKTYKIELEKRGKIYFFENGTQIDKNRIVFKHFIKVDESEYSFSIKLDNSKDNLISGRVKTDSMFVTRFPFAIVDEGCEIYANHFSKE